MGTLKIGVVGVGYIGAHRVEKYQRIPGVEVVGVVDPDPQAEEKSRQMGVARFSKLEELYHRVDAVSIAVPTPLHFQIAKEFLGRKKHVLLEKPIARSIPEAEELVRLAREVDVVLQIGHTERFNPIVRELACRVRDPKFFEIHRLSLYSERGTEVDVVMDLMIHDLDILSELVLSPPTHVASVGVPVLSANVDIANARIEFEGGTVANITASRVSLKRMRKIRVFQPDGYFSIDCDRQEGVFCRRIATDSSPQDETTIEVENLTVGKKDSMFEETRSFIDAIRESRKPVVGGEEGARALELAEKIVLNFQDNLKIFNDIPNLTSWLDHRVRIPSGE